MTAGPEFALTDEPRTGSATAQADAQSKANPDALVDRAATAGIPPEAPVRRQADLAQTPSAPGDKPYEAPKTAAEASTRVSEQIAARAGFADDSAPLGDPNAPQGSGPETDMSRPENRPAPIGKIRMSEFEAGPDHEQ